MFYSERNKELIPSWQPTKKFAITAKRVRHHLAIPYHRNQREKEIAFNDSLHPPSQGTTGIYMKVVGSLTQRAGIRNSACHPRHAKSVEVLNADLADRSFSFQEPNFRHKR